MDSEMTYRQFLNNYCENNYARFVVSHMMLDEPLRTDVAVHMAPFVLQVLIDEEAFNVEGVTVDGKVNVSNASRNLVTNMKRAQWIVPTEELSGAYVTSPANETPYQHVDDFIDTAAGVDTYARWVLNYFRSSAALKYNFEPYMAQHKLFGTYREKRYRVTGASRLGDVWLTEDYEQREGYQHRVEVSDISNWSNEP